MVPDCLVSLLQYIGISYLKIIGKIGSVVFYDNSETTKELDIKWKFMNKVIIDSIYSAIEKGFIKK